MFQEFGVDKDQKQIGKAINNLRKNIKSKSYLYDFKITPEWYLLERRDELAKKWNLLGPFERSYDEFKRMFLMYRNGSFSTEDVKYAR